MRAPYFDAQKVIEYLQGTCQTINDGIETFYPEMDDDDLTPEDHQAIDNEIFLCDRCGWWCEISENAQDHNSGTCVDCVGDEEDDQGEDEF